jgi:hypothetical protein
MASDDRYRRIFSTTNPFLFLTRRKARRAFALTATLLLAFTCLAQQTLQTTPQPSPQASASPDEGEKNMMMVPAGTKIALVLTRSIKSKSMHPGDPVYAQTTFPVFIGNRVAIPQGTFVQGNIERLARKKGSRGELQMRFTSLIFANGYVAGIPGPMNMVSDENTAWADPGTGKKVGAAVALSVPVGGALVGAAAAGAKGAAIGGGVGAGVGILAAMLLLSRAHNFTLWAGSPIDMILQQPLSLDQQQIAEAVAYASEQPPAPAPIVRKRLPAPPLPSTDTGTCYTPGTPGTPDIYIPGTPPIGDTPGTPGTVIPGTPATPPTPHPCP